LNEPLRQALIRARLREDDVAVRLDVDPKTVRRWLDGRVPYPKSRSALADLVGADEADLWPDAGGPLTSRAKPEELGAVYPHRWAIPRDVWRRFFESAEREIGVLAYSALFLVEDAGLLAVLADKASRGVRVRIALGDPDSACVAQRGQEEGIGDAMAAKVRNALTLYRADWSRKRRDPATPDGAVQLDLPRRRSTLRQPAWLRHPSIQRPGVLFPRV
jgi:phosphatidylserine/phosphatidylglycerophosphate/cardiolipin synthase-like enzyme